MKSLNAVVFAVLLVGCSKRDAPSAAPPPAPSMPTKAAPEPAKPTPPKVAEPTPPIAKTLEPPPPEPAPPEAVRPPPPTSPGDVCVRACNKAQQCATSRGGVSACIDSCLKALSATDAEGKRDAFGFRAQEKCADVACGEFGACVSKAVVGVEAASKAPPMASADAKVVCKKLCDKEKECKPEEAASRIGGEANCLGTCQSVLVSPDDAMAVQRAIMKSSFECADKPCADFDPCVHEKLVPTPAPGGAK